jgi:hypothetical protein
MVGKLIRRLLTAHLLLLQHTIWCTYKDT